MIVPVVVRMIVRGGSALTGRVSRHSTTGFAVVAAASLAFAQLEEGVGRGQPHLGRERGVVGGPFGKDGARVRFRPGFLTGLWHTEYPTTTAVLAPGSCAVCGPCPILCTGVVKVRGEDNGVAHAR